MRSTRSILLLSLALLGPANAPAQRPFRDPSPDRKFEAVCDRLAQPPFRISHRTSGETLATMDAEPMSRHGVGALWSLPWRVAELIPVMHPLPAPTEVSRPDGYTLSSDPARLGVGTIHAFLSRCYWLAGIPVATAARAVAHSLCVGLYAPGGDGAAQVGFVRLVTDRATFAYLCDVYVLEEHRGRSLGAWLIEHALAHPTPLRRLRSPRLASSQKPARG